MIVPSRRQLLIWGSLLVLVLALGLFLMWTPLGKPDDEVRTLYLSPKFGQVKIERILSKPNGRGWNHLPRSITVRSSGPPFDAYLLDVSALSGKERISAVREVIAEVETGAEPSSVPIQAKHKNVTTADIPMFFFPWGRYEDGILVVAAIREAEVTVRISYGGSR